MRIMRVFLLLALLSVSLLGLSSTAVQAQDVLSLAEVCEGAIPAEEPETRSFSQAEQVLVDGVDYRAIFCTDAGAIYVDLFEEYAPKTVNNFVFLAQQNYYNNILFHRVMENFMAQGGDPTGTGTGGPGYQLDDEFVGFLHFDQPGLLAMANAGPGTNGSQFFLTTTVTDWLNFQHTVFGQVLDGYDNVLAIEIRDPQAGGAATTLNSVVIVEDIASVATEFVAPAKATQDEVVASFAGIADLLPPEMMTYSVDVLTTEDVVDLAAEDVADFLSQYGHEYRVQSLIGNVDCDFVDLPFATMGYTLDAYASKADATAALADPAMDAWLMAEGFSEAAETENTGLLMRVKETTACDVDAVHALTVWQRGRFVATAEIVIPADNENVDFMDVWLTDIVGLQVYESMLSDVLRPEIWQ